MAAKHSYGNISEFDQALENWEAYIEQIEQYFVANEVTSEAKKKSDFTEHMWSINIQHHSQFSNTWQAHIPGLFGSVRINEETL